MTSCGLALALLATAPTALHAQSAVSGLGALAVVVRDVAGRPVAGAVVSASGPVEREAVTGAGGAVTLQTMPFGTYVVRVVRSGFAGAAATATVGASLPSLPVATVSLTPATFANDLGAPAMGSTGAPLVRSGDPVLGHAVQTLPNAALGPVTPSGAPLSLYGTLPEESRVELDGIPLAAGASGFGAVRFQNALALETVSLAAGPFASGVSVRDAVGGVLNEQTVAPGASSASDLGAGYDSALGAYGQVRYARTAGRFGVGLDAVVGDRSAQAQVIDGSYALSSVTSLGVLVADSQATAPLDGGAPGGTPLVVRSQQPVSAFSLRTLLGDGTFQARTWRSGADTTAAESTLTPSLEDDRLQGTQLAYSVPAGPSVVAFAFDRQTEAATVGALSARATYTTVSAGASLAFGPRAQLELGGAVSGGTLVARRFDPRFVLDWQPANHYTLRAAAGGAFATAPGALLAVTAPNAPKLTPETSFAADVTLARELGGGDRVWLEAYRARRDDVFASLAQADAHGLSLGFTRAQRAGGLGLDGFVSVVRSDAFGAVQPLDRELAAPALVSGAQLPGIPYAQARLEATFGVPGGAALRAGASLFGANNAYAPRAFESADASVALPLGSVYALRAGVSNAFGHPVAPALWPYAAPRQYSVSLGRSTGP